MLKIFHNKYFDYEYLMREFPRVKLLLLQCNNESEMNIVLFRILQENIFQQDIIVSL